MFIFSINSFIGDFEEYDLFYNGKNVKVLIMKTD